MEIQRSINIALQEFRLRHEQNVISSSSIIRRIKIDRSIINKLQETKNVCDSLAKNYGTDK